MFKILLRESLCESIGEVVFRVDIVKFKVSLFDMLTDRVVFDVNSFSVRVKGRVFSEYNTPVVVAEQWGGRELGEFKFA
jgi:hypothetical protein